MKQLRLKNGIMILLSAVLLCVCFGCTSKEPDVVVAPELKSDEIYMYSVDADTFSLEQEVYQVNYKATVKRQIQDVMNDIFDKDADGDNVINSCITMERYEYSEEHSRIRLRVNTANELNDEYLLVLSKAALTRTLIQLPYIDSVIFEIYDPTIINDDGSMYEVQENYNAASFVDMNVEGTYLQKGVITLYFANATGDGLIRYEKGVELTNNVSLEQLVIDSLIEGPLRDGYEPTIPAGTEVKKISVKDGVCYLDLSSEFSNTIETAQNATIIYSVVNSLCELPNVNKVQFLVEGEIQPFYRESVPLDGPLEANADLIVEGDETE